jgi:S1-C subfamily serine protease
LTAAGLLALTLLLAGPGPGPSPRAARADPDQKEPNKEQPKPRQPGGPQNIDDIQALRDALQKSLDRVRQQMEDMQQRRLGRLQDLGRVAPGRQTNGRLGVRVEKPGDTLVDQLDLPQGEGLVVVEVAADSAAAAAGLKPHDILLEFAGKPVPADGPAFVKMVQEAKPGTPLEATVLRKGRKETIKGLTLPEGKPASGPQPRPVPGAGLRFRD